MAVHLYLLVVEPKRTSSLNRDYVVDVAVLATRDYIVSMYIYIYIYNRVRVFVSARRSNWKHWEQRFVRLQTNNITAITNI